MSDINSLIKLLPFSKYLSSQEIDLLSKNVSLNSYKKGDVILESIDDRLGIFLIIDGSLRVAISSENNRIVTMYYLSKGDTAILSGANILEAITFDAMMIANSELTICIFDSLVIKSLINRNPYVKASLYELLADRYSSSMQSIKDILFKPFKYRLISSLIEHSLERKKDKIKITFNQLAEELSSSREVVSRHINELIKRGYLVHRRGYIYLKDKKRLSLLIE